MNDFRFILYQRLDSIAKVTLNRPETRNAQHVPLLRELDEAFRTAEKDPEVKVIVLTANGPHFSSGHDIGSPEALAERAKVPRGAEARWAREADIYLGLSRRWRDIPKPTIAAVQGYCVAGGLMLCWPCDIIIASEDAKFGDPVLRMGIGGVEYFAHPWELGPRKAKELLFTGQFIDAQEAWRLGMVNRVVPRDRLEEEATALARKIAEMPSFALAMAKQAVNAAVDAQGQRTAMDLAFGLHQLAHTHNEVTTGSPGMGMTVDKMKSKASM